jgi:hypothetical protein
MPASRPATAIGAAAGSAMMPAPTPRGVSVAMTARELVERLNLIQASVNAGEAPEVADRLHRAKLRLKEAFEPEQLKAALKDGTPIPTTLEEEVTTLTMEWMQKRGAG